ncbi:hypothetical protein BASA62_002148 [Batrachochytrium salamandrivorans]|nr:hypothetical protein BASA62_002148 [Batrachochytrium salamandrivorans]
MQFTAILIASITAIVTVNAAVVPVAATMLNNPMSWSPDHTMHLQMTLTSKSVPLNTAEMAINNRTGVTSGGAKEETSSGTKEETNSGTQGRTKDKTSSGAKEETSSQDKTGEIAQGGPTQGGAKEEPSSGAQEETNSGAHGVV